METNFEPKDLLIISKDFDLKDDKDIEFLNIYDISKAKNYFVIISDEKVFLSLRLNLFGSTFFGNYLYEESTNLIIKEIDPVLLMINIFYSTTKIQDKFSTVTLYDVMHQYMDLINNHHSNHLTDADINNIQTFLDFLLNIYFVNNETHLEKICEKVISIFFNFILDSFNSTICYRLNISKIMTFLQKKVFFLFI